ncbi:MAG: alpha-glucosidase C-terminal domain-containing protein [Anaerolineales bacterium]|nr:alpha-glucosidase C-terminal domain-containing protein [Anaerolineales bacterium]
MHNVTSWLKLGLFLFLLAACAPSGPKAVQPVEGLPQGTDGFAWWNDTVFYQIFVRSFYDSNGDGIGDFNGIVEKLDYLNDGDPKTSTDLGVTGLWLMPINPSPSYHGYDVVDYYGVNEDYGMMDDFKRLLEEAHKHGIRIIIDLVLNHTSSEHPWFIEARDNPEGERYDWYVWAEEDPGWIGPWGQEVWYPTIAGYYYAIFWSKMPDLNYTNPAVTAEMQEIARFWLEDVGVDGFRLDAARHLVEEDRNQENTDATHTWWENFRLHYKEIDPHTITVGEIWTSNYAVKAYVEGDELDLAFNFDLASSILKHVNSRNARGVRDALKITVGLFEPGMYATFLTNHDQERVMSQFREDWQKARLAATVLLTIPGVPYIYYGEEIGMIGKKPDEKIRTPMQWSAEEYAGFSSHTPWMAIYSDYTEKNVAAQSQDPASLLSLYRDLIHLRNDHAALRVGDYIQLDTANADVLAFLRVTEEEIILVAINFSEQVATDYTLSLKEGPFSENSPAYLLYGSAEGGLPELTANQAGGFTDYLPVAEIPGSGCIILQFLP